MTVTSIKPAIRTLHTVTTELSFTLSHRELEAIVEEWARQHIPQVQDPAGLLEVTIDCGQVAGAVVTWKHNTEFDNE